ncbi:MAG: terminase [bacterium]|nr:terminase [bacterium]
MKPGAKVDWKITDKGLTPFVGKREMAWAPQAGSQIEFISCPVFEVLYEGTRGPGKTIALLVAFYQYCGKGFRHEWKGIIFRRTYPELRDIIDKSRALFSVLCPQAKYNATEHIWTFPDGEKLIFAHFKEPSDYYKYHGHAYPFIGWEELCSWPTDLGFKRMISCCRSTRVGMPRMIRATANPYGVGHNWVKARYKLPIINERNGHMIGKVIRDEDGDRVSIHGELRENKVLLHAQPNYVKLLRASASCEAELKAWLYGDWNIVAGGMFDDLWDNLIHVVPNFPFELIPPGWRLDRSFDWGQSKPFSVGWWAESNGEEIEWRGRKYGMVRGDLYRIAEWYGWSGKANEGVNMLSVDMAAGIRQREIDWQIHGRVRSGPADTSIFDDFEPGKSVAGDMAKHNIYWEKADKARKQGWLQIRKLMKQALPNPDGPREDPGIFALEQCEQYQRLMPVMSRKDRDLDDIDTDSEDHLPDEVRYRVRRQNRTIQQGDW